MSLADIYAEDTEAGFRRWAANPPPPDESFKVTSFIGAGLRGIPQGAMESLASGMDLLSGFGNILAATDGGPGGMFSIPDQKQQEAARQKMLAGEGQSVAAGNQIRGKAEAFGPDPLTAHTANQIINGLTRFATKAVTDVGTMGPVVGAAVLGLDEANTVTQKLRTEGVDTETAVKVGAVQGAFSAAGAVMPFGGKTVLQTLGLVAAGGPVSFMGQEAMSREILKRAGYENQASLHNPFDPVGLAVSTIIPGAFGGLHIRGQVVRGKAVEAGTLPVNQLKPEELRALKYDDPRLDEFAAASAEKYGVPPEVLLAIKNVGEKSGPTAIGPETKYGRAVGVMQFLQSTAKEMGLADRTDPLASIDAAARYMKKLYDQYASWDAAVAHYNGGGTQAALVLEGKRPTYNQTAGYLDRVRQYITERTANEAAKNPENVDAARVAVLNETLAKNLPDAPDAIARVQKAADAVASGDRVALERAALGEAYDQVWRTPQGDAFDPLVQITPDDIESTAIARGGWKGLGDAEVKGSGFGLVKVIWRHGEESGKSPELQVARDDVLALPEIVREYEPDVRVDSSGKDIREWRVERTGPDGELRRLVYADKPMDEGGRHVVTVFVQESGRKGEDAPLSKRRSDLSPESQGKRNNAGSLDTPPAVLRLSGQEGSDGQSVALGSEVGYGANALPASDGVTLAGEPAVQRGSTVGRGSNEAAGSEPQASIDHAMATKLAQEQPKLEVVLPGSDETVTVSEALSRIAEEQKQDAQWADLIRVAAECALGS